VPVWGHLTDGHQSASTEHRCPITPRRQHRPALGDPRLVADRQLFAGATRAVAPRVRFVTVWVPTKQATRGRPPQDVTRPQLQGWRVTWQIQEATEVSSRRAPRARRCVLATKVLEAQQLADTARLRGDKGQPAAALRCQGAKHPAAIAPIVLAMPTRMAALGGVSLIALLVYPLVERQVRNGLAARGETPPERPAPSRRPTARTVFHLMRNLAVVTRQWTGQAHRQVTMLDAHQLHVLRLLGDEPSLEALPRRNSG
jgi:hypothetical protein